MRIIVALACVLTVASALAQESASYKLSDYNFNSGGFPQNGTVGTSASFRLSLGTAGEPASEMTLGSASYQMDGGFTESYPPPGEATGLGFTDKQTLVWDPEGSTGDYRVYRDLVSALSGLGYGSCLQDGLLEETATDTELPPSRDGFFYLVTVRNRLNEEGPKGDDSNGDPRPNPAPCP